MLALSAGFIGCGDGEVPEITEYNVAISSTEGGSITTPGEDTFTYDEGDVVNLVAEADEGYQFANWTGDVDTIDDVNGASTTITMNGNYSITANFIARYVLTIDSTDGGDVTTPGEGVLTYDEVTVINLVAEPDEDCRFVGWTGDVSTIANVESVTTTITVDSHYSITANFAYGPAIPPKNADSFVQMIPADVDSLDPAWGYGSAGSEQVSYIYETLLFYESDKADEFVPVLATEWELLDDNVSYRFKIRDGVKFHEGGELTPSDVEYSFERAMVQDRLFGPIWMLYQSLLDLDSSRDGGNIVVTFDQIDDAVEVDGDWIQFNLANAAWSPVFLHVLCTPWASIVDKEWCVASGEWDGTEQTWRDYNNTDREDSYLYNHTNGTGPWKLEEWDPGIQIKLAINNDYWREPAPFETVITRFVEDWTTRKEALLAGDVDLVYPSFPGSSRNYSEFADIEELDGISDLNIYKDLPTLASLAFFFNFDIASESEFIGGGELDGDGIPTNFFSDIDVRKGFCYAFDYETFVEDGWLGEAQQIGSPVCEGLPYFNPDASMHSLDLAKAEEHLKAAWAGEVWEKGFKFTLLYPSGSLWCETACDILAENLLAINPKFQVSIQPTSTPSGQMMRSRTVPMFLLGWGGDYPHPDNFVVPFMASYGVFAEHQGYGYPELDLLIEEALKELDPEVQQDLYYQLQERYYEDAPSIMLCQPLSRRYFTKYIRGFYFHPMIPGRAGPLYYMSKSSS